MLDHIDSTFPVPATYRPLHPTMGQGVAERTYLRRVFTDIQREKLGGYGVLLNPKDAHFRAWNVAAYNSGFHIDVSEDHPLSASAPETRWEVWSEVAQRVALGNVALYPEHARRAGKAADADAVQQEYTRMAYAIANGSLLMSGRHLQQGDIHQPTRNMEVFSNCATAPTSFALFMLLLNGAGVGRDYSDTMMVVDWAAHMPAVVAVLDEAHPDFVYGRHISRRDADHLYAGAVGVERVSVADSREGWGKVIERIEEATFYNQTASLRGSVASTVNVIIFDFTPVREEGAPIMGMQGRPSSGPAPLMEAVNKLSRIKGTGMKPWRATLYIDHYLSEPVLVGGARRSARMSTKWWQDEDIFEFVGVKRPVEFHGKTMQEVMDFLREAKVRPTSFLWSSNNSVAVDADFWARVNGPMASDPLTLKAKVLYTFIMECNYGDGTGEPGFINVDRLSGDVSGLDAEAFSSGAYLGSEKYAITSGTRSYLTALYDAFMEMPYKFITNPCGEIALCILGGFCVIADTVPYHCDKLEDALEVARIAVRALMRVNTMPSIWQAEVARTNRIGVGITGIHEFAWKFFRVGFKDIVNPDFFLYLAEVNAREIDPKEHVDPRVRAAAFWEFLGEFSRAVRDESITYAKTLGVAVPHTCMTVKPSGSVSKLYGLTEGWHLPSMRHYLRWVQYHKSSPMIEEYRAEGYPVRELKTYKDHWIVGFPTEPEVCKLGMGGALVTAAEASMADQYQWLRLGEFFLMEGGTVRKWVDLDGCIDLLLSGRTRYGNQISYTMKYLPDAVSFHDFSRVVAQNQKTVRCCSIMPQSSTVSYEYLPEQQVSVMEYQTILSEINRTGETSEDVGLEHLDCSTGACPIVFTTGEKSKL